ncbi:MAG: hypothetical protein HeimC3_32800 [Candidatus Heimdallarchaeota archaeon LC_3]|nr:MAG: hypothetical protein HeimC3_32800 [Candidatus Heimdallarchaeota archaeon LC_3]
MNIFDPDFFNTTRVTHIALTIFLVTISIPLYVILFYPVILEGKFSTTIGKRIFGLWVINNSGIKITWKEAFIRSMTKLLPLLLLIDALIAIGQKISAQRATDMVLGTRIVVNKRELDDLEDFIEKVSKLLPFSSQNKEKITAELRLDLRETIGETVPFDLITSFGEPRKVAKDIMQGEDWVVNQANPIFRTIAYIIDLVISILIGILIMFIPMGVITYFEPEFFMYIRTYIQMIIILFVASIPLYSLVIYPLILEGKYSTTIGKYMFRLKVLDNSGIKISWNQALIRSLSKIFPLLIVIDLLEGYRKKKTFCKALDIIAESQVVKI